MQDHFVGMVTTLANNNVTNTEHPPFRHLIRLIVQYVYNAVVCGTDALLERTRHIMDPQNITLEDLPDLLATIYTGVLCNAIDPLTYQTDDDEDHSLTRLKLYNASAMSNEDRAGCSLARSCAYELRNWLCHHYEISGPGLKTTKDCVDHAIAHQAVTIYAARMTARSSLYRPRHFTLAFIKQQLLGTFEDSDPVQLLVKERLAQVTNVNATGRPMFVDVRQWTVKKKAVIGYKQKSKEEMTSLGVSPNDRRYLDGVKVFFMAGPSLKRKTTEVLAQETKKRR